jgi:hypothetical protein
MARWLPLAGLLWPVLQKLGLAASRPTFVMEEVVRFSQGTA